MSTATATKHPAYEQMEKLAGVMESYHEDFTKHDTNHLAEISTDTPFLWAARKNGSHIYSQESVRHGARNGWKAYGKCAHAVAETNNDWTGWYQWDGYRFKKVSTESAAALLDKWEKEAPKETQAEADARHRRGGW